MSPLYDATPAWLRRHGLERRDAQRLFRALCTLADYEGVIKDALYSCGQGGSEWDHMRVCAALRYLVDGESR